MFNLKLLAVKKNEQLSTTCLDQDTDNVKEQVHPTQKDAVLQHSDSSKIYSQGDLPQARLNMPNKPCNQSSVMQRFMQIKVPSLSTPSRANRNSDSKGKTMPKVEGKYIVSLIIIQFLIFCPVNFLEHH